MKYKAIVEYEYPIEHKPPVKADIYLHGDKVTTREITPIKTGHWIEKNVNQDGTHNIYCSNCNNYQKFKGHANSYNARTKLKYCPNCGAEMGEK